MKKALWAVCVLFVLLVAAYFGLTWAVSRHVSSQMTELVNNNPAIDSISYDKLKVGLLDRSVGLDHVLITLSGAKKTVGIDRAKIFDVLSFSKSDSEHIHIDLSGINIDKELIPGMYDELDSLGYPNLVLDVGCLAGYEQEGGRIDLQSFNMTARGLGEVQLRMKLENIDLGKLSGNPGNGTPLQLLFSLPSATLSFGEVGYTDQSFAKRFLSKESPEGGTFKTQAESNIDRYLAKEKREDVKQVFIGFKEFIQNPDQLTLTFEPQSPVSFLRLATVRNLSDLIDLMQVSVTR
jgi:hypothetical protein